MMKAHPLFRLLLASMAAIPMQAAAQAGSNPVWVEYPAAAKDEAASTVAPAGQAAQLLRQARVQGTDSYGDVKVYGEVTPQAFGFDYFEGVGEALAQPLEKYGPLEGWGGSARSDGFVDLEADLTISNGERDLFTFERRGFGPHNHHGAARFDDDEITLTGAYAHLRSLSDGIDYLYSPAMVAGADDPQIPAIYDPDNYVGTAASQYYMDRTSYGAGVRMKPALLGGMASLAIHYEGYKREGMRLVGSEVSLTPDDPDTPADEYQGSWRGTNLGVDERMNRISMNLTAMPEGWFELAYDVSLEKFTHQGTDLIRNDIMGTAGQNRQSLAPFYFVPDSTQLSNSLRLTKYFGDHAVVSAGYGLATVDQDNFPRRFTEFGDLYTTAKISSQSGFLAANVNVAPALAAEGYAKYSSRDNDSSFPVPHVISTVEPDPRMDGPRINSVESLEYGLSATWRPGILASTVSLGWQHLHRERDLTYSTAPESVPAERMLYRDRTRSDEVYLKWIARPVTGMTLRITPSFVRSGDTGLVSEPKRARRVKTLLSYASPSGWLLSGFYDYRDQRNNDMTLAGSTTAVNQNRSQTLQSAGLTFSRPIGFRVNTHASLFWVQNDLENYLISYTLPRSLAGAEVYLRDLSNYRVDSYVLNLGADWQVSQALKLNGSYTYTHSTGDTAGGSVEAALVAATGSVDGRIDNTLHSVALGADYDLTDRSRLRAGYYYDYYDDEAYGLLTGGVSILFLGLSYGM